MCVKTLFTLLYSPSLFNMIFQALLGSLQVCCEVASLISGTNHRLCSQLNFQNELWNLQQT